MQFPHLNKVGVTEEKRVIDEWLYNLIYHYDYILRTHAYIDERLKFTVIKQSPLAIIDAHESKKRILQFLLGRLSMIPAPYSRVGVARSLIDSYVINSEQFSEGYISIIIDDYLKQFVYVTMGLIERVFHVVLYEVIVMEEKRSEDFEFFKRQRELMSQELKEFMDVINQSYPLPDKNKYPESKESILNKEIGVFLHSCCYYYHNYNTYDFPELENISERSKREIINASFKIEVDRNYWERYDSDNVYHKGHIQTLIQEKLYDLVSAKREEKEKEVHENRAKLIEQYLKDDQKNKTP